MSVDAAGPLLRNGGVRASGPAGLCGRMKADPALLADATIAENGTIMTSLSVYMQEVKVHLRKRLLGFSRM